MHSPGPKSHLSPWGCRVHFVISLISGQRPRSPSVPRNAPATKPDAVAIQFFNRITRAGPTIYRIHLAFSSPGVAIPKIVADAIIVQNNVHDVHNVHGVFTNGHHGQADVLFRSVHISLYGFVSCAFWNSTQSWHCRSRFSWDRIL
jgi:hypothetical protein